MRTLVKATLLTAVIAWGTTSPVSAATLTLVDTFGGSDTTWTLDVQDNCELDCSVVLSVFFEDPAGAAENAYAGTQLQSIQWVVSQPNLNPDDADIQSTTGAGNAPGSWDTFLNAGVNANGCGAGANDAVCSNWNVDLLGLPVVNNATYSWTYSVDWSDLLTVADTGNIRAAFHDGFGQNGKAQNFNIFSPGGGTFTPTTTEIPTTTEVPTTTESPTTENIPEPTLLTLLGAGLVMAGRRMRTRKR